MFMGNFQQFWDELNKEIQSLIDPTTQRVAVKYTVKRDCVVCSSSHNTFLFDKYGFTYVQCSDCSMIFTDPVLSQKYLDELYEYSHALEYYASLMTVEAKKRRARISSKIATKIHGNVKTEGGKRKWLDIGCGYGALLRAAGEKGYSLYGIEPSKDCQKKLQEVNVEVYDDLMSAPFSEGYFDVISLKQVIEHLFDPKEVVSYAYRLLKPGGVLWIATPNTKGVGMKIMKEHHPSYQRGHINMFSTVTLRRMVLEAGFQDVRVTTYYLKTIHLLSYLKRRKDTREDVFKMIDTLPKEGGVKRFLYYNVVVPTLDAVVKATRNGDYVEVFGRKS